MPRVCLTTHVSSGFSAVLPAEQDQRPEERNCPGADNPLLEGEGLEEDQPSPRVLVL